MSQPEAPTTTEDKPTEPNQLNAPHVNPETGKPKTRAVNSAKQAYGIAKSIRDRAVEWRLKTAGIIDECYNGDPPFKPHLIHASGQGWRNNFSTNFIASIIDRVVPQITEPQKTADLLVHKALPPGHKDGATKSRKFNEVFTKRVRGWSGWTDLLDGVAQEVVLRGNACVTRLDEDWRPRVWRYDEVFLPEGTGQHANHAQVACFEQTLLMHEFLKLFRDKKTAELAGYNYKGCIKVANEAAGYKTDNDKPTELQDAIREQSPYGYSYNNQNQTRTVKVYHVVVLDYSGEIDLWTVSQTDGTEIRQVIGRHETMEDCIALFTMQRGNRKFYGSKGLGRLISNLHIAIERHRNYTADKIAFSGYPIIKSDDPAGMQLQLRYPFFVAPSETQLLVENFQVNWEASEGLDAKLVGIAESIAGAFIPPNIDQSGSANTKIEAAQKAERDIAVRQGVLARFANQSKDMLDMMCRGMFNHAALREGKRAYEDKKTKEANAVTVIARAAWRLVKKAFGKATKAEPVLETPLADEQSVAAVVELMDAGLTAEEIAMLAVTPSGQNNEDEGAAKDNQTLQYLAVNKANPYIDQAKAARMEANIVLGPARAQELVIPEEDNNVKEAAIRQQTIEMAEMLDGYDIGVVGGDNHAVHRQALAPHIKTLVENLTTNPPTPEMIKGLERLIIHYDEHLVKDQTMAPENRAAEQEALKGFWETTQAVKKALIKAAEQITEQRAAGAPPQGANGAPPNGTATDPIAQEKAQVESLKAASDIAIANKHAAQKDRELTLKERQQNFAEETKAIELEQENVRIMAQAARDQAAKDAANDLSVTAREV